jgi:hypothetical protein
MHIEIVKAIHDGYETLRFCDAVLQSLDPPTVVADGHRRLMPSVYEEPRELHRALAMLVHKPKAIRDRVELLEQELTALLIQGMTEIREAAAAQLEKL